MSSLEKRWHPLLQEWVIIAATTGDRPWKGEIFSAVEECMPAFDDACYLCPGVTRASGIINPVYTGPWGFTNDFASFSVNAPNEYHAGVFERVEPAYGINRVICYTPIHNLTLADLTYYEVSNVIDLWAQEFQSLRSNPIIKNILIFENKGRIIGVSSPHPHGQIYATNFVPRNIDRQRLSFVEYYKKHHSHLLCDLLQHEVSKGTRIICQNDHFVSFIPFFARFAYETYIVPRRQVPAITDLTKDEMASLADILKTVLVKFDALYRIKFPNNTIMLNAPTDGAPENSLFHFHIEFYPPLRSGSKQKFIAGFDLGGGNVINSVEPEVAAWQMRNAPTVKL